MDDVKRHLVMSLAEYIDCIKKIKKREKTILWFRGHSKASYKLLPGILRAPFIYYDENEEPITHKTEGDIIPVNRGGYKGYSTKRLLSLFKNEYKKISKKNSPKDDFEWLCLMQHYGIPTRLLDWSTNSFTALLFASSRVTQKDIQHIEKPRIPEYWEDCDFDGGVVYAIAPIRINALVIPVKDGNPPFRHILELSKYKRFISSALFPTSFDKHYFNFPICVMSNKFDHRILAQHGVFMVWGPDNRGLESLPPLRRYIHKIFIPRPVLAQMAVDLRILGLDKKTLFPDQDKAATIARNRITAIATKVICQEEDYLKPYWSVLGLK